MFELPVDYTKLHWTERKTVREQYIKLQNNKCFYCKGNLDDPPPDKILEIDVPRYLFPQGFFDYPVHLQHDHTTGMTEGAVHSYCNAVMWVWDGK